jgi:hypothetical protein
MQHSITQVLAYNKAILLHFAEVLGEHFFWMPAENSGAIRPTGLAHVEAAKESVFSISRE